MIKTYSTLQRGQFHSNHCEDFLIAEPISSQRLLLAVMDGCSMAKESTFAAMLFGKLLRKIARDQYYQDFIVTETKSMKEQLKSVLESLFYELVGLKNRLGLDRAELLCTLNICLLDESKMDANCLVIGDGLIFHDGIFRDFEQADSPDYLGYHLGENFSHWYDLQTQFLRLSNVKNLAICTDGIFTFKKQNRKAAEKEISTMISFLLEDDQYSEQSHFLERKIRFIHEEWGLSGDG